MYTGVAVLALGIVLVATGGGLFGSETYWFADWQHRAFRMLCHQDPSRSFWIDGTPMAVCTRCYGIYSGFALLWLSMPLLGFIVKEMRSAKKILLAAVVINVIDVVGNMFGFWQNTLVSRFLFGNVIGFCVVLLLAGDFLNIQPKLKRDAYGLDGTTEYRT